MVFVFVLAAALFLFGPGAVIFFLTKLFRLMLLGLIFHHVGQHAVIFFIEAGISFYVPAGVLFPDMHALHHIAAENMIAQELILREIVLPQPFHFLVLRLGKVPYLPADGQDLAGSVDKEIRQTLLLGVFAIQGDGKPLFLGPAAELLHVRDHIVLHIDLASAVCFADLRNIFW